MKKTVGALGAVILILVGWQVSELIWHFSKFILPTPGEVWHEAYRNRNALLHAAWPTLQEILFGFSVAILVGVPLSLILATSSKAESVIYPLLVVGQTIPIIAIAPLFLIWFGFGLMPKIVIAFLISFFPIVVNTTVGLKSVPQDLLDLVASTGASWVSGLRRVRMPYALPSFFGGLKIAITFATIGAIVGEFVGTSQGLGYVIQIADGRLDTSLVFAAVIVLSAIGLILFQLMSLIERLAIPWHSSQAR